MGKTLDNYIELASTPEETSKRVLTAFTDPQRSTRNVPGRPGVCNVYSLHQLFGTGEEVVTVYDECAPAQRGCVDCKRHLAANLNQYLDPLRERRREFEKHPDNVKQILDEGGKRAREIAKQTIGEVYEKMGLRQYV